MLFRTEILRLVIANFRLGVISFLCVCFLCFTSLFLQTETAIKIHNCFVNDLNWGQYHQLKKDQWEFPFQRHNFINILNPFFYIKLINDVIIINPKNRLMRYSILGLQAGLTSHFMINFLNITLIPIQISHFTELSMLIISMSRVTNNSQ